jgi:hypothetical protein
MPTPTLHRYGSIHYTLYTIHYTLYSIHYTLYTIHYICTIHYTLYTDADTNIYTTLYTNNNNNTNNTNHLQTLQILQTLQNATNTTAPYTYTTYTTYAPYIPYYTHCHRQISRRHCTNQNSHIWWFCAFQFVPGRCLKPNSNTVFLTYLHTTYVFYIFSQLYVTCITIIDTIIRTNIYCY